MPAWDLLTVGASVTPSVSQSDAMLSAGLISVLLAS